MDSIQIDRIWGIGVRPFGSFGKIVGPRTGLRVREIRGAETGSDCISGRRSFPAGVANRLELQ
jgi:hypothetical protein